MMDIQLEKRLLQYKHAPLHRLDPGLSLLLTYQDIQFVYPSQRLASCWVSEQ